MRVQRVYRLIFQWDKTNHHIKHLLLRSWGDSWPNSVYVCVGSRPDQLPQVQIGWPIPNCWPNPQDRRNYCLSFSKVGKSIWVCTWGYQHVNRAGDGTTSVNCMTRGGKVQLYRWSALWDNAHIWVVCKQFTFCIAVSSVDVSGNLLIKLNMHHFKE